MKELPKAYEPSQVEDGIYKKWEESGAFNPDNLKGDPYSIMMPPPNVTGVLHLGHALENSLMDAMARFQRMRGKKVLLLPGTDHAAVATQAKVEKVLMEQGVKHPREEFGREKLLEKIRVYAENSKTKILKQIKKMGTSCDWSRLAYTFDEARGRAVNEVFIKMYNDGLIYRGYRVVNWSVKGQSTCSDDELVHLERQAKFYTFKYSKDFPIAISTTRPETKLGDTAVAVNTKDERYKKYIGKVFTVDVGAAKPLEIKIIADEIVDPAFGTGALGVTPAHSAVDFEMYVKQKAKNDSIGIIPVIGTDGKMTKEAGKEYSGLTAVEAREKFVAWLEKNGLLEKTEDTIQNVGTSDRFGDIVEALPMTQWFIDVNKIIPDKGKTLKDLMREAVTTGHNGDAKQKITINPDRFEKIYLNWITNLRDWCISRQIWWGHRIPAWFKGEEIYVGEKALGSGWVQDEDTLDTWFSSGLWTFSTLGWPDKTADFKTFHPTSWMQMGYEILFFWMARMILMSTYNLDQIPFKDVYIHGILRNEEGKKFSKSSGDTIDPLEVSAKYGTDALRFSLISGIAPGNDSRFYYEKVEGAKNLINKIWNISRYIIEKSNLKDRGSEPQFNTQNLTLSDNWILSKIDWLEDAITKSLSGYAFSEACEMLRSFTWNDFADWYLEISKFEKNEEKEQILIYVLENLLKLWHPFIPFVTESIWAEMGKKDLLMTTPWPQNKKYFDLEINIKFDNIIDIIKAIRNARAENKVEPAKKIKAVIYAGKNKDMIESQAVLIKGLRTGIESLEVLEKGKRIEKEISITAGAIEIYLLGARDEIKEKARINKELESLKKQIKSLETKLNNKEFVDKAPKAVVDKERERLATMKMEKAKMEAQLKNF